VVPFLIIDLGIQGLKDVRVIIIIIISISMMVFCNDIVTQSMVEEDYGFLMHQ